MRIIKIAVCFIREYAEKERRFVPIHLHIERDLRAALYFGVGIDHHVAHRHLRIDGKRTLFDDFGNGESARFDRRVDAFAAHIGFRRVFQKTVIRKDLVARAVAHFKGVQFVRAVCSRTEGKARVDLLVGSESAVIPRLRRYKHFRCDLRVIAHICRRIFRAACINVHVAVRFDLETIHYLVEIERIVIILLIFAVIHRRRSVVEESFDLLRAHHKRLMRIGSTVRFIGK